MRAKRRRVFGITALASLLALALAAAPTARAHDDDDWDDDDYYDDDSYYDDDYGYDDDRWSHDGWCTYDRCSHGASIPYYESLAHYGAWRYVPAFGTHLYFPYVDRSWRPYFYGHWVRTTFGMTWVSHEPWGDIPHHYGNWVYVAPFGWGWVPGWDYSPAWVTWSVADGYVGWAPCPPRGYRYPHYRHYDSGVRVSWYGHRGSYGYHDSGLDFSFWIFVGSRDFYHQPVYRHALARPATLSLWKTKRVQPAGLHLDVNAVQKVTREKIRTVSLDKARRDVGGRKIEVYSPRGQKEFIRSGEDAAKRSYVKPAGLVSKGSHVRVERAESPSSAKSREVRPDRPQPVKRVERAEKTKPQREEAQRVEKDKPRREEPSRVQRPENAKPQRDEAQRVEKDKPRREPPARAQKVEKAEPRAPERAQKVQNAERKAPERAQKVQNAERRAPERAKVADKPASKPQPQSEGKSKSRSEPSDSRGGKKSGR